MTSLSSTGVYQVLWQCPYKHSRTDQVKNSFSRIGAKIWNSIPDSDRVLPKYKFKNSIQSRLLDILIQEDTYVGLRTLLTYLVNIKLSV